MASKWKLCYTIIGVIRTIKIWWLLRKLYANCHNNDERHVDHIDKTGHVHIPMINEGGFLKEMSSGNAYRLAEYSGYLSIAENKMKLLDSHKHEHKCANCGCAKEPSTRCIGLNDDGLEFIGISDLSEYLLTKYKTTWAILIIPFITGYFLPHILSFFGLKIG